MRMMDGNTPEPQGTRLRQLEEENHQLHAQIAQLLQQREPRRQHPPDEECTDIAAALRESEQRFRATFEQAAVGIAHVGLDGRWLRVNQRLCEILGYIDTELQQRTFQDITYPADLNLDLDHLRKLLAGDIETYTLEKRYRRQDGSVIWAELTVALKRTPDGAPDYFISVIQDISARKELEKRLRDERNRARQYLNIAEVMLIVLDRQGCVTLLNPKGLEILGYTAEAIIGKDWFDMIVPQQRAAGRDIFAQLMAGNIAAAEYAETTVVTRSGQERLLAFHNTPIRDDEGMIIGTLSSGEDITERRRGEEALRESEERFRSLFEQSRAVMLLIDSTTGEIVDANLAAGDFYGYTLDQLRAMTLWEINTLPSADLRQRMAEVGQRGRVFFEFQHRLANGEVRDVEVYSGPIALHGRPLLYSIVHDATERRQAERERNRLLAELEATINSFADGVVIYDNDGVILRTNPVADHLLDGLLKAGERSAPPQWITQYARTPDGHPLADAQRPEYRAHQGEVIHGTILVFQPIHRGQTWIAISAGPIRTPDGRMNGVVATYTDITQLHELQEQREIYIHTVSHDLRAPLTAIQGHAQLLKVALDAAAMNGDISISTDAIVRSAQRMNVMIQDLVDAARLEGKQLALHPHPINLADYVSELCQRVAAVMDTARLQIDIPADLPPVAADDDRLERILMNLLSNAMKYSTPDTPVRIEAHRQDHDVVIAISDQGPGIDPHEIPRLFERFYRGKSERKPEGIGLGLYITRMLVEAHGGRIWVTSTPGIGSTFAFTLPLA